MNTLFFLAMKKMVFGLIAGTALLGVSQAAATSDNVSLAAGTLSVAGTISTDDHIGVLVNRDINDWNLTISGQELPRQLIRNHTHSLSNVFGTGLSVCTTDLICNSGWSSLADFPLQVICVILARIDCDGGEGDDVGF
jgi:hypothetical protein